MKVSLLVLFGCLIGVDAVAARCGYKGCSRYASSDGYCQLHVDYGVMQRMSGGGRKESGSSYSSGGSVEIASRYEVPNELMPAPEFDREWSIMKDPEIWTNSKGVQVEATWTHISRDRKKIYLTYVKNRKYVEIPLSNLSVGDRKRVTDRVKMLEDEGRTWRYGAFLTKRACQLVDFLERAKGQIREKDRSVSRITCIKVFQALKSNGLCTAGHKDGNGRYVSDYDQTFFYKSSGPSAGPLADGDTVSCKRFYWAGTYTYTTVNGVNTTVNMLTDDVHFAIDDVMRSLGWKFQSDQELETIPSQPERTQPTSLHCTGSGFFVSKHGYLVTNAHVVEGGNSFSVLTSTGKLDACLVKVDQETDLALLKVDASVDPLVFSSQRVERLGTEIFTVGFPQPGLQGFSPKVTKGIVSGQDGYKGDVREYQIDASIQPGNSGGPLLDQSGLVVGVIVASLRGGQVVNYAIKKSYLMAFIDGANCSVDIVEGKATEKKDLAMVVDKVRDSCVLVLNYK